MTTSERAVREASRERLLRDFALAAYTLSLFADDRDIFLKRCEWETSRTRYACLMTAFGL